MNACVNAYEMRMPAHYVDMNKKEMEYDGGWWFLIGLAATVVDITASALCGMGVISKDDAQKIGTVCTAVSIVCGVGGVKAALKAGESLCEALFMEGMSATMECGVSHPLAAGFRS